MTREDMHDLILGVALVALGYAVYHHRQATTAKTIAAGDQAAIQTAIDSGANNYPAINVPAPIPVNGNASTGFTIMDTSTPGWMDRLTNGVY